MKKYLPALFLIVVLFIAGQGALLFPASVPPKEPACAPVEQLVRIGKILDGSPVLLTVTDVTLYESGGAVHAQGSVFSRVLPLAAEAEIRFGKEPRGFTEFNPIEEFKSAYQALYEASEEPPLFLATVHDGEITRLERFPLG